MILWTKIMIFVLAFGISRPECLWGQETAPVVEDMIFNFEGNHTMVVDAAQELGPVNRLLFGNSFLGHAQKEDNGWMDWGGGVWNPNVGEPVQELVDLAHNIGVSVVRFPGGSGTNDYDWKRTYWEGRTEFLFGLDEFMRVVQDLQAVPVVTLSYFTGDENDAADLVEYLNAPADGNNPNGGVDWAQVRADKGHPVPYNVVYFELGNEVFNGNYNGTVQTAVDPSQYAYDYLTYRAAMRNVDPNIRLGLVLDSQERNRIMFSIIQNQLDFMTGHSYPDPGVSKQLLEDMDVRAAFLASFVRPLILEEYFMKEMYKLLEEVTGLTDVPMVITEYNAGFLNDNPVPYRHALGSALINAELLRIFMNPQYHIFLANHHYLANDFWGMVESADPYMTHDYTQPIIYKKRPSYYVFELYHKNFGDILVDAQVTESSSYRLHEFVFTPIRNIAEIFVHEPDKTYPLIESPQVPYLSVNASKSQDGNYLYLMVVNKSPHAHLPTTIDIQNFGPIQSAHAWVLNGDNNDGVSFEAVNEGNPYNVRLKHIEIPVVGNTVAYAFERHSVTSIVLSLNNLDYLWGDNSLDQHYRLEAADGKIYTYNPDGTLTIEHPAGGFWEVQIFNTGDGNIIWARDKDGIVYTANGDGTYLGVKPNGQKLLYDKNFNLTGVIDENGTVFHINADGTMTGTADDGTIYHYAADWQILDTTDAQGNINYYDGNGQVIRRLDGQGTEYVFNADGTITGTTTGGVVTVYTSQWSVISITDAEGQLVFTTDADGTVCDYFSDGTKRCRKIDGEVTNYNAAGDIVSIFSSNGTPVMVKDPDGSTHYFDAGGSVIQSVDSAGNITDFNLGTGIITRTLTDGTIITYSAAWQIISRRESGGRLIEFNLDGTVKQSTEPDGTQFIFNADGTISGVFLDGTVALYDAQWQLLSISGADGRTTYYEGGSVVRSVDPEGNEFIFNSDGTITGNMINGYVILFDANWQVISVTPPA